MTRQDRIPEAYLVHPLLDPRLPSRQPALARFWIATYRRLARNPESHHRVLMSFVQPLNGTQPTHQSLEAYFRDADTYLDDLLRLLPTDEAQRMRPRRRCRETHDLLALLRDTFEGPDPRTRYEAQRKLQLSKMLFDVDHCRTVRDGPRHRALFEQLLEQNLWSQAEDGGDVTVCYQLLPDAAGLDFFRLDAPPWREAQRLRFSRRRLPAADGEPEIVIYHHHSRFKREATRVVPMPTEEEGILRLAEAPRWPGLGRRSGSILSKMIRRAVGDPHQIHDILGAMFIVGDARQAHALERRLLDPLGGPFRWRDRVDTLTGGRDLPRLNERSAGDFKVIKKIVDILTEDRSASAPYLYSVEIQIYPIDSYLRTIFDAGYVGHDAYKRRQFLLDLMPTLFPEEIFGPHGNELSRVNNTTG